MASDGADRISSLPNNVREHILMFLPLRDAAKASVLSTNWRNMWTYLPTLVIDENFGCKNWYGLDKLLFDLCRVLVLHRGPLKEFSLSLPILREFPDHLGQILLFLQNKHIESLTIKKEGHIPPRVLLSSIESYELPVHLFSSSFSQIKTLRLSLCKITSPSDSFEAFSLLTVLELRSVVFYSSFWSFRCPLLSSFTMESCDCFVVFPDIVIEAPKLTTFHFVGNFNYLHFKHTPVLKKATLHKHCHSSSGMRGYSSFAGIWGGLVAVEWLSVSDHFYQYLVGVIPQSVLPNSLEMLRHITSHDVCLSRQSDVFSVLRMIGRSPNLQRLAITLKDPSETSAEMRHLYGVAVGMDGFLSAFEDRNGRPKFEQSRLRRVEVKRLKGTEHEMAFIRWLMNSSPALDMMKIQLSTTLSADEKISTLTNLNGVHRASTRASILIS